MAMGWPWGAEAAGRTVGSGRAFGAPPWLSFSGRCPWVVWPGWSTGVVNGSGASSDGAAAAIQTTMIPIDSYQLARVVS